MTGAAALLESIRDVVGANALLTDDDVRARPASWFDNRPCGALAIVRPGTTEEIAAVMSLCYAAGQAVVPAGGNTGVVEGTLAGPNDIMISTERMKTIEATDVHGATITAEAGVPLEALQLAALEHDLMFSVDFGARGSATVGGAIATNAGGNSVIRYGMMREQILGLEAVLADGTIVSSMNRMLKNNAGYDLKQLFVGTEGTLGFVTRAVLRLRPAMTSQSTALLALERFQHIPEILRRLDRGLGGTLTAFEVMWSDFYRTVTANPERHTPPLPNHHRFYILVEACGVDTETDSEHFESLLGDLLEAELVDDAILASSSQQRDALWAIRDDIEGIQNALGTPINFDISVPIADVDEYVRTVTDRLVARWPDSLRMTTFGHLGDSNIHFILSVGTDEAGEKEEAKEIVYAALEPFEGSISAEHGIGLEKLSYLKYTRSDAEIALMRRLKQALDPRQILNPGKVLMQ